MARRGAGSTARARRIELGIAAAIGAGIVVLAVRSLLVPLELSVSRPEAEPGDAASPALAERPELEEGAAGVEFHPPEGFAMIDTPEQRIYASDDGRLFGFSRGEGGARLLERLAAEGAFRRQLLELSFDQVTRIDEVVRHRAGHGGIDRVLFSAEGVSDGEPYFIVLAAWHCPTVDWSYLGMYAAPDAATLEDGETRLLAAECPH
jgi:hypothetical protein